MHTVLGGVFVTLHLRYIEMHGTVKGTETRQGQNMQGDYTYGTKEKKKDKEITLHVLHIQQMLPTIL